MGHKYLTALIYKGTSQEMLDFGKFDSLAVSIF